jgi:predicted GNAT family acetyltransferase
MPDAEDEPVKIEHDEREQRFFVRLDDGDAELAYTHVAPNLMDIQHTFVPQGARGQGVAEALAEHAFQVARERGWRVVPTCPFVRKWLASHPEHVTLVDARYAGSIRG